MEGYIVVNAPHLRSLEAIVNIKMQDGWQPLGGVYSTYEKKKLAPLWIINDLGELETKGERMSNKNWCQAMIK